MVIETALPFSFCKSTIHFFRQWSCYVTFINYVINYWIYCFFSAIAFWSLIKWFRCDVFIMSFDDFWHIVHAAVADFNCIVVENFVKFVASWKMLCYQMKECLCNVCWNGVAKGWVKPYYVLLSCFWFFWFGVVWTARKKLRPTIKTMLSKSQNKNLTHKGTNTRKHMTQETH